MSFVGVGTLVRRVRWPLLGMGMVLAAWIVLTLAPPLPRAHDSARGILVMLSLMCGLWLLIGVVSFAFRALQQSDFSRSRPMLMQLVPFLRRLLKFCLGLGIVAVFLRYLGLPADQIATGLGLTGLVVVLALRRVLDAMVSGFLLSVQRPFMRGDRVKLVEDRGVTYEGTVQRVTLPWTELWTAQDTVLRVPNDRVFHMSVENFGPAPESGS